MSIDKNNVTGSQFLFTNSTGRTSWWNLRLLGSIASGAGGAQIEIKVNGDSIPLQGDAFTLNVDPTSFPTRTTSRDVLLNDGDVVSADIQGPSTVNLSLFGDVSSEQL